MTHRRRMKLGLFVLLVITFGMLIGWGILHRRGTILPVTSEIGLRLKTVLTQENNVYDTRPFAVRIAKKLPKQIQVLMAPFLPQRGGLARHHMEADEIVVFLVPCFLNSSFGADPSGAAYAARKVLAGDDSAYYLRFKGGSNWYSKPVQIRRATSDRDGKGLYAMRVPGIESRLEHVKLEVLKQVDSEFTVVSSTSLINPIYKP